MLHGPADWLTPFQGRARHVGVLAKYYADQTGHERQSKPFDSAVDNTADVAGADTGVGAVVVGAAGAAGSGFDTDDVPAAGSVAAAGSGIGAGVAADYVAGSDIAAVDSGGDHSIPVAADSLVVQTGGSH